MATFPIDHEASMGFGPRPPTDMPNPMEETASEQRLWAALWLYPEISSLTRSLVGKLKDAWDYDSAFLLEEILEFQIIYKEYQEANVGPVAFFLGDGALLTSADVMGIARTVSTNLIKYQINDIYQLVGRELQMKVLGSSILLARLLGLLSPTQNEHRPIKDELLEQLEKSFKIRAAAKKNGDTIHNLGDDDLLIRYALEPLSEIPGEPGAGVVIFRWIANTFFAAGFASESELARALAEFQIFKESPDKLKKWDQHLHELYRLTLGLASLAHYTSTVGTLDTWKNVTAKSKQIVEWLVIKIESLFRNLFSRLQRLRRSQITASTFRIAKGTRHSEPPADELHGAFGLLHAVKCLATDFGSMPCFNSIKNLCRDLIEQSAPIEDFQPLRLKAMETLISIKDARLEITELLASDGSSSLRTFHGLKEQSPSTRIRRELDVTKAMFIARKGSKARGLRLAVEEMESQRRKLSPAQSPSPIYFDPRQLQSPSSTGSPDIEINMQTQGTAQQKKKLLSSQGTFLNLEDTVGKGDRRTESSIANQISKAVSAARASKILSSDNLLLPNGSHESGPNDSHSHHQPPTDQFETRSGQAYSQHTSLPQYPGRDDIHELPAEVPHVKFPTPPKHHAMHGSIGSIITSPQLNRPRTDDPASPLSPQISPASQFRRPSEVTAVSSSSSVEKSKEVFLDFQVRDIEVSPTQKVKFLQNAKRGNLAVLSPDGEYAAFAVSNQLQVCRISPDCGAPSPPETKLMLTLEKKGGQYVAADISNQHLVAISSKEIQICKYRPFKAAPASVICCSIDQGIYPYCIKISPNSDTIAVGQRVESRASNKAPVENYAVIQLYSTTLILEASLRCRAASDGEFPRNVSFFADGQTMLYSNNRTFGEWAHGINGWEETALGTLDAKGPGAKGVTSITPISLISQDLSVQEPHDPISHIIPQAWKHYLVTSVLSNMADSTSSYTTPLSQSSRPAPRSASPWGEHLLRSAVSPTGRLAAFLTDSGRIKLARLVPSDKDSTLRLKDISTGKLPAKKGVLANNAGSITVCEDSDGFTVVAVDRTGAVQKMRVLIVTPPRTACGTTTTNMAMPPPMTDTRISPAVFAVELPESSSLFGGFLLR